MKLGDEKIMGTIITGSKQKLDRDVLSAEQLVNNSTVHCTHCTSIHHKFAFTPVKNLIWCYPDWSISVTLLITGTAKAAIPVDNH